jgi:hypothetical protein
MSKLTLAALACATFTLVTPADAARGGGVANLAMLGPERASGKIELCRQQRTGDMRRKPCKIRRGWFAEGLDPLIR